MVVVFILGTPIVWGLVMAKIAQGQPLVGQQGPVRPSRAQAGAPAALAGGAEPMLLLGPQGSSLVPGGRGAQEACPPRPLACCHHHLHCWLLALLVPPPPLGCSLLQLPELLGPLATPHWPHHNQLPPWPQPGGAAVGGGPRGHSN